MAKRSTYQDRAIRNYYQNQDTLMPQRLGELVAHLYLAEGKNREGLWKRAAGALEKLKVPKPQIDHLTKSDNPALFGQPAQAAPGKEVNSADVSIKIGP